MNTVKRIFKYLKGIQNLGLWFSKKSSIDLIGYLDADFTGCKLNRKSTGRTWFSKKQNLMALSMTEVEYIATGSCYAQILWIKQQLIDFEIELKDIPIRCDNTSTISLTKNSIQHSRSKLIEIRHHFIRKHVQNNDVVLEYINTEKQLADIFSKILNEDRFYEIRRELGILDPST